MARLPLRVSVPDDEREVPVAVDGMAAQTVSAVVAWAVPAVAGAVAGWAARALRSSRERRLAEERRDAALVDGVVALLRGEIARAHQSCVVEGRPLGREGAEYLRRAYESYRRLGGNDVGEAMYRQIAERGVS